MQIVRYKCGADRRDGGSVWLWSGTLQPHHHVGADHNHDTSACGFHGNHHDGTGLAAEIIRRKSA
jgi:hypothetical protein